MSNQPGRFDIPEEFWSAYSEQPFEVCIDCETPLIEPVTDESGSYVFETVPYLIQKHFVAGETVFEMALCLICALQLQERFSESSRRSLTEAIATAPERRRRQREAEADPPDDELAPGDLEKWQQRQRVRLERAVAVCALCGVPRSECHRYSLGTACAGMTLLCASPEEENLGSPFVICEQCEINLTECISRQTRDEWDRFVEDHFDGPPALEVDPRELVAIL